MINNRFKPWRYESGEMGGSIYTAVVFTGAWCWVEVIEYLI